MDTILIGIAGGTGSGKTTLADKLVESFGRDEVSILRHDNYYKRHDDIPFEERAKLNYDHPDAFDTDLLCQHILELKVILCQEKVQIKNDFFPSCQHT